MSQVGFPDIWYLKPIHNVLGFSWSILLILWKNSYNLFQGPPNPGFRSIKVQTETIIKKDSRDFKKLFYLGFLMNPQQALKVKLEVAFFVCIHNCKKNSVSALCLALSYE